MAVEKYKIDIKSNRNDSGWIIQVTEKKKYFYISSKEYLLPHDLEVKLSKFLDSQAEKIKEIFNVNISIFMGNEKFDSKEKAIEFVNYMDNLIKNESTSLKS